MKRILFSLAFVVAICSAFTTSKFTQTVYLQDPNADNCTANTTVCPTAGQNNCFVSSTQYYLLDNNSRCTIQATKN